jgi:hypothetical protein
MSVPVNIEAARKELFGDDQHYPIVPYGQISRTAATGFLEIGDSMGGPTFGLSIYLHGH